MKRIRIAEVKPLYRQVINAPEWSHRHDKICIQHKYLSASPNQVRRRWSGRSGKRRTTFLVEHAFGRTTCLFFFLFFFCFFFFYFSFFCCAYSLSVKSFYHIIKVPHLIPVLLIQLSITLVARFTCKPVQSVKTKQSHVVPNTAIIIMTPVWFNSLTLKY